MAKKSDVNDDIHPEPEFVTSPECWTVRTRTQAVGLCSSSAEHACIYLHSGQGWISKYCLIAQNPAASWNRKIYVVEVFKTQGCCPFEATRHLEWLHEEGLWEPCPHRAPARGTWAIDILAGATDRTKVGPSHTSLFQECSQLTVLGCIKSRANTRGVAG
jgi:hypothetical protein